MQTNVDLTRVKTAKTSSSIRCLLMAAFFLSAVGVAAGDTEVSPSVFRVSLDSNYPPYAFLDSNGVLSGYSVDLWKLWEQKTGIRVELIPENLDGAIASVIDRKVDAIDTIFRTEDREQFLAFTAAYAKIPVNVYTHTSLSGIVDTRTLQGFMIGVKIGDACIGKLEAAGIYILARYQSYKDVIQAAQAEQIKAFCMDEPAANYLLYKVGANRNFRHAFQVQIGELHRAVAKGQDKSSKLIESGFARVLPAELMTLNEKWMGRKLPPDERFLAGVVLAIFFGGGALAFFGWRLVQRRNVELETEQNHMRTLVHTLPDMVWIKSRDGVVLACNPALSALYGISEKDIVGKTDYDLLEKEVADSFRRSDLSAIAAGKTCSTEEWFSPREAGAQRLFEVMKAPMYSKNGALVGVLGIARDITERRQTENALRASEQKFAAAFRSSPDAIIISRAGDGRIIDVNEAFLRLSGYQREELVGRNGIELDLWGDNNRRDFCFGQLREVGWIREVEGDFRIRSGELRSALTSGEIIQIDAQPHILWVVRDITERRRMESALRSSEQKFASAFRSSPNALVLAQDSDEHVVDVNAAFERLSGFKREEMIGRNGLDIGIWIDKDARSTFLKQLRHEHRISDAEVRFQDKTGHQRVCLLSGEMLQINGTNHLLWVVSDVTERRSAEEKLRISEQKFAAAFRICPDASLIVDYETRRIVEVNDSMLRISGYDYEELIGASTLELQIWVNQSEQDQYLTMMREHGGIVEMEASFRTKIGGILVGLLSAELLAVDGRLNVLGFFHDNTIRHTAERKLKKANSRLKALSARLLQIQEEERCSLARELHDEIGQSLTAQKIALQSLCLLPELSAGGDQIRRVVSITETVLNQVRNMSLDLRPPQLDDLGLSAAIRWNLARQSSFAGFTSHLSTDGVPVRLPESIATACYRISQEALTNAIKHGHALNIWVSLVCHEGVLRLEVRDDGEGFDPSLLEEGKSMGMIGMQERARLAGGRLFAIAQPGSGCTIKAQFPL